MAGFEGFGPDTVKFLRGLERHNEKAWFEAHRADYESAYLAPALAFIGEMSGRLPKFAPGVHAEPRVNGSLYRINRDVRFSKDKTPYKDHMDFIFWDGPDRKAADCAFLLRVRSKTVELGVGAFAFDKNALARFRERVADPKSGRSLEKIVAKLEKAGDAIGGEHYKKLPRGFDPISPERDRLLRFAGLTAFRLESHPPEFGTPRFATWCSRHWRRMLPLRSWLLDG